MLGHFVSSCLDGLKGVSRRRRSFFMIDRVGGVVMRLKGWNNCVETQNVCAGFRKVTMKFVPLRV